jgi:hypothetical protein
MDLEKIEQYRQDKAQTAKEQKLLSTIKASNQSTTKALSSLLVGLDKVQSRRVSKVDVTNDIATKKDIQALIKAVTALGKVLEPKDLKPLSDALAEVVAKVQELPASMPKFPEVKIPAPKDSVKVTNLSDLSKDFKAVVKAVSELPSQLDLNPNIEVKPTDVIVQEKEVDLKPLVKSIEKLDASIKSQKYPVTDIEPVVKSVKSLQDAIQSLRFPVPNYILPFRNEDGAAVQAQLSNDAVTTTDVALAIRLDDTADPILYIGKALVGSDESAAVWQIAKLDTSSGLTKTWAGTGFDQVWANRTTLTYS